MDGELVLQRLNDFENGALGFLAGAIEAVATQPLTYWKNAAQQGLGFTLNPRLLYRGTTVSAINDGTLTAFQFAASGWFQKLFAGGVVRELSPAETLASAFLGGCASGVPCCVLELCMIQQQRWGGSLLSTPLRLMRATGGSPVVLSRGFVPTAAREGFFCAGYLGVAPLIERKLDDVDALRGASPFARNFIASTASGLAAAALTHPADTVKSCMQGDVERATYGTLRQTTAELYRTGGVGAFFKGYAARAAMIACCFIIFNEAKVGLAPVLFADKVPRSEADKTNKR